MNSHKYFLLSVFLFFCTKTNFGQDVVFTENFDSLKSISNWTFNNQVEYAHFLGVDGSNYVRFHPVSIRVDLVSPGFNVPNGEYRLHFDWNQAREQVPDSVTVFISLNDGKVWKELTTFGMGNQRTWQSDSISLGLIGGENIKVRFTRRGQRGFPAQYLNLDNIKVVKTPEITSIKDDKLEVSMSIFPNPSNGNIRLSINNPKNFNLNYSVYSNQGQLIINENISSPSYYDAMIDLSYLSKGSYFFSVSSKDKVVTYPIIIQ